MSAVKPEILAAFYAHRNLPPGSLRTACYAPFASLYFNTNGDVLACCQNARFPLGNVERDSLDSIWRGARAAAIRKALRSDNFAAGCQFCQWQLSLGNYANSFIRQFDRYPVDSPQPEWPQLMEFAVSNTCNLECVMCLGALSSSIRANREKLPPLPKVYGEQFFAELRSYLPHLRYSKFLGGEPFLAAESFRIWELMEELGLNTPCHVTTNGTQYNARVERILERHPVDLAVSLDAITRETFEAIRINARLDAVLENFRRFHQYARDRRLTITIPHCLMRQNWREFGRLLLFADEHDCPVYVNLVREPPECTLYTLPLEELKSIVKALEREGAHLAGQLTLNRRVWDETLADLQRHIEHSHHSARAPFDTPYALVVHVRVEDFPAPENRFGHGDAQRALAQWAPDAQLYSLAADADDRVTTLGPDTDEFFGLRQDECVGRSSSELIELLARRLGPVRHTIVHRSARYIDRVLEFAMPGGGVQQIRMFSWPTFGDFGTPLGAEALAAASEATIAGLPNISEAAARAEDWAQGRPVATWLTDLHDSVCDVQGSLEPAILDLLQVKDHWPEDLLQGVPGMLEVIEYERRPGYEDRLYEWRQRGESPRTLRVQRCVRRDEYGQVVGWTWVLAAAQCDARSAQRAQDQAQQQLNDWGQGAEPFRLEFDSRGRFIKASGSALDDTQRQEWTGLTRGELQSRWTRDWGQPVIVDLRRTADVEDVTTRFETYQGPLYQRIMATSKFDDAGRYAGTLCQGALLRIDRAGIVRAVERVLDDWQRWGASAVRYELVADWDLKLREPPPDEFAGVRLDSGSPLIGQLQTAWGEARELLRYQAYEFLETVLEFPGRKGQADRVVRLLLYPRFTDQAGQADWKITAQVAVLTRQDPITASARLRTLLTDEDPSEPQGELVLDDRHCVVAASMPSGWPTDELQGQDWIAVLGRWFRSRFEEIREMRFSRHPDVFEVRWSGESRGERIEARALRRPRWNEQGELVGGLVLLKFKLSQRLRADQHLAHARQRLRDWNKAHDPIVVQIDGRDTVVCVEPAGARLLGIDLSTCVGCRGAAVGDLLTKEWGPAEPWPLDDAPDADDSTAAYFQAARPALVRTVVLPKAHGQNRSASEFRVMTALPLTRDETRSAVQRAAAAWPREDGALEMELSTDLEGNLLGSLPAAIAAIPAAREARTLEHLGAALAAAWGTPRMVSERFDSHLVEQQVAYEHPQGVRTARSLRYPDFDAVGRCVGWRYAVLVSQPAAG